ncbi:hypothetical protein KAU19_02140 [Candidatus Parcubacteria bacterium]|nr:hypothetical protein [Candidatus Parcubacteria bacterium]
MELLASIFIIALLTGIFLTNYHGANQRNKLIMATQKLAGDIRMAQNYALGAKEFDGDIPAGGWGVHFDTTSPNNYIIFADNDEEYDYDAGEEYSIINLPDGVIIDSIDPGASVDIVFLPPNPDTYINGADDNTVKIILKDNNGNTTKTIEVNFFGLIDVVD